MQLRLLTPPAKKIQTLEEAKEHLCLPQDFTEQNTAIISYIDAATSMIDGASGILNRGLITQTWTGVLDAFPAIFSLPLPPVQSVTEIRYTDTAGDSQTVGSANYRVSYTNMDFSRAFVEPVNGFSWPSIDNVLGAVEIDFVVGYGDDNDDLPQKVRQVHNFLVASQHEHRRSLIEGLSVADNPIFQTMVNNAKYWEAV